VIYLITGVPGSGKTLYAVSTLVQKLLSEKVPQKDGSMLERRLVVDGIRDLVIPHEMMAERPDVDLLPVKGQAVENPPGNGLWNWFEWCKPGDIICVDEVQRFWRPRGMGTKPPPEIQMLETHRHLGVDFVLITQNPMLIDQNVRRLVGRHQNIRRLLGMARAIIYDWDSCAADVTRTKTATSSLWAYPKSAYKLYASSVLHLKQKQKIPAWLAVPVLAVVAGLFVAPMAFGTLSGAMTGKGISSAKAPDHKKEVSLLPDVTAGVPLASASSPAAPASSPALAASAAAPVFAGCIATKNKCNCYDEKGAAVPVEPAICSGSVVGSSAVPKNQIDAFFSKVPDISEPVKNLEQEKTDASVLAFVASLPK